MKNLKMWVGMAVVFLTLSLQPTASLLSVGVGVGIFLCMWHAFTCDLEDTKDTAQIKAEENAAMLSMRYRKARLRALWNSIDQMEAECKVGPYSADSEGKALTLRWLEDEPEYVAPVMALESLPVTEPKEDLNKTAFGREMLALAESISIGGVNLDESGISDRHAFAADLMKKRKYSQGGLNLPKIS